MVLKLEKEKKILVIVPHEDDELNIMGGFLPLLVENGNEVNILFMINGDFKVDAIVRYHEARKAMNALGISSNHIYFLGYPDVTDESAHCSLYRTEEAINSYLGNTSYGVEGIPEYRMLRDGHHSPCSFKGMLQDLEDFLLDIRPDIIFCVDFDHHHDHRLCTLAFEQTLEKLLLQEDSSFVPEVYKTFAYSTAYEAPKDFYNVNLLSVPKPTKHRESQAENTELENPFYLWEDRVRLPISVGSSIVPMRANKLYPAMEAYKSQLLIATAQKMINSDVVTWRRETAFLSKLEAITVSSGDGSVLKKFSILDVEDISNFGFAERALKYLGRPWQPDARDQVKQIKYIFKEPIDISEINIYQSVNVYAKALKTIVTFDNGYSLDERAFTGKSRHYKAVFTKQNAIREVVVDFSGTEEPFAIELIDFAVQEPFLKFAKIVINDNYAYGDYYLSDKKSINLTVNSYGLEGSFIYKLDGKALDLTSTRLDVMKLGKKTKLQLLLDGEIIDEINLIKLSEVGVMRKKIGFIWDKLMVYLAYKKIKIGRKELKRT